jgi:hypothetical protein
MAKNSLDEVYRSASNLVKSKYSIVLSRSSVTGKFMTSLPNPKSTQGKASPKPRG